MNELTVAELREFALTITPGPRLSVMLVGEAVWRVWRVFSNARNEGEPERLRGVVPQPPLFGLPVRLEEGLDPHVWMIIDVHGDPVTGGFIVDQKDPPNASG